MAVDISAEIVINKPRDEVAAFASDPGNEPTWSEAVSSAQHDAGRHRLWWQSRSSLSLKLLL